VTDALRSEDVRVRVAALEILKSTMRTRDYVMKGESEGRSLTDAMHDGLVDGMQTFDDEIEKLWNEGIISKDTALAYASNPTNLALRLTALGFFRLCGAVPPLGHAVFAG